MRWILAAALLAAAAVPLADEARVTVLDNGLTVITQEMDFTPAVAVATVYRVGVRNETPQTAGISHFTEHMLFNGTERMPGNRFWQVVQMYGGSANGGTSPDHTLYFLYFPATRLAEALDIERDRMRNCPMDSATIAEERGVVLDEWRGGQTSPDAALSARMDSIIYGRHPYSMRTVGTEESILEYDSQSVRRHYDNWYRPSNAAVVIAGSFDTNEALAMVEERFGDLEPGNQPELNVPRRPELEGPIRDTVRAPARSNRLVLGFPACGVGGEEYPELSCLATYLSSGGSSWLDSALVQTGLASSAFASAPWRADGGVFRLSADLRPGVSADSVEAIILGELARLGRETLSEPRMAAIRTRWETGVVLGRDSPLGAARIRGWYWGMVGDPMLAEHTLAEIEALRPRDIRAAASETLVPENMVSLVLVAEEGRPGRAHDPGPGAGDVQPPEELDWEGLEITEDMLAPPRSSVSEGVDRFELDNGLTLLVLEDHTFPITDVFFSFPMGRRMVPPEKAGLAELTGECMVAGPPGMTRQEFHRRLNDVGSSIWIAPNSTQGWGSVWGLSRYTPLYIESLADVLVRPALREEDFAAARGRQSGIASRRLETPYWRLRHEARLAALEGARVPTPRTIEALELQEVADLYGRCVRPSATTVAVVGDVDPEEVLALVERELGDWQAHEGGLPEAAPYDFVATPDTVVVSMPGMIQSATAVLIAAPGVAHPDYAAFSAMGGILGGGANSRLGRYIREQQGLAYSAGGFSNSWRESLTDRALYSALYTTANATNLRALESTVAECRRLAAEGAQPMELQLQKTRAIGRHALGYDTYGDISAYLARTGAMGLPLEWDLQKVMDILDLTLEDVDQAAREYLAGDFWVYSAGGIDEDLRPLENTTEEARGED